MRLIQELEVIESWKALDENKRHMEQDFKDTEGKTYKKKIFRVMYKQQEKKMVYGKEVTIDSTPSMNSFEEIKAGSKGLFEVEVSNVVKSKVYFRIKRAVEDYKADKKSA
jgi:hypothetical protein